MGAHTAFLTASTRPDLVDRLVMLEGHVAGDDRPEEARKLGDLRATAQGLYPRFDPDVMRTTVAAVHAPRWAEWENLVTPTLAVFAEHGMFTEAEEGELIRRRPGTRRADIPDAGHDAHLDDFDAWSVILRGYLAGDAETPSAAG